ncbi:MAG: family 1 glycosylhydrolase, partial [Patescibacteria group bacterium]
GYGLTDWDYWPPYLESQSVHPGFSDADIKLAKKLGIKYLRFSIEWARVNRFPEKELNRIYHRAATMKKYGIEPIPCFFHTTLPYEYDSLGGWRNDTLVELFAENAKRIALKLKPLKIKFWMTFNEPSVIISRGYIDGHYPPGEKLSFIEGQKVLDNILKAHKLAYYALHDILDEKDFKIMVGISHYVTRYAPYLFWMSTFNSIDLNRIKDELDYVGLNYYGLTGIKLFSQGSALHFQNEIYPPGIYDLVKDFRKYGKPIIITENGVNDEKDSIRVPFIVDHLIWLHKAIKDPENAKAPVIGYFYWTLFDNYEWDYLKMSHYGLIEVDSITKERKPRPSAYFYKRIIEANGIANEMIDKN